MPELRFGDRVNVDSEPWRVVDLWHMPDNADRPFVVVLQRVPILPPEVSA